MQKHAMMSLMSLTLLAALPAVVSAAPDVNPDPTPVAGEVVPGGEGVATYAPPPSSNGLALSLGQGVDLVTLGNAGAPDGTPLLDSPDVGLRIGYRMNNLIAFGTLAYSRLSASTVKGHCIEEDTGYEDNCKTWGSEDTTFSLMTIGAGARYLFDPPTANLTTAYGVAGFALSVPGLSNSAPGKKEALEKLMTGAMGFGFNLGGGAEYFVGEGFSIGGEAGLAFHSLGWGDGNQSLSSLHIYTSVLLNFYL